MNLTHEERQERTDEAWRLKELWTRHRIMDRPPLPAERPITIPPTPPDYWTQQKQAVIEESRESSRRISSEIIEELKREGRL